MSSAKEETYYVSGKFIGINIGSFTVTDGCSLMTGNDLKTTTIALSDEHPFLMHTMPGNDVTCLASPLYQWCQTGAGLATPYQAQQGKPENGLANFYVSPIPTTFKGEGNRHDMGQQRYLLEKYIAQLYYYAGLGFSIAVPVRKRGGPGGSRELRGVFHSRPNEFVPPTSSLEFGFLSKMGPLECGMTCYEYAFGAGVDPHFCKNHGAFLEKEFNKLGKYINTSPYAKKKQQVKDKYSIAFRKGQEKSNQFKQDIARHKGLWDRGEPENIDAAEILKQQLETKYFSYDPPILENALIDDPDLRREIEVAMLRLKKEIEDAKKNKMAGRNGMLIENKNYKWNYLKNLLSATSSDKTFDYDTSSAFIHDRLQSSRSFGQVIAPPFSRTRKLIEKIQERYPIKPKPYEPVGFFLIDWILGLFHHYETQRYDAAKTKYEQALQPPPAEKQVIFPNAKMYLVVHVDTQDTSNSPFWSTSDRCSNAEIVEKCCNATTDKFHGSAFFSSRAACQCAKEHNDEAKGKNSRLEAFVVQVFLTEDGEILQNEARDKVALRVYNQSGKLVYNNFVYHCYERTVNVNIEHDKKFVDFVTSFLADLKEKVQKVQSEDASFVHVGIPKIQ